jgi:hypothetical protein
MKFWITGQNNGQLIWRPTHVPVHMSSSSCTQLAQHVTERERERERERTGICLLFSACSPSSKTHGF